MNEINRERILLGTGISIAAIYFLNLFILAAVTPGYSHMRNWVSALGSVEAPYHGIFNAGLMTIALLYIFAGLGFFYSVQRITGRKIPAFIIGVAAAAFGVNLLFAALYPMPDPRHGSIIFGLIHFITPLLMAWAIWRIPASRLFMYYQLLSFVLIVTSILIMNGTGGLVNQMNLGFYQRLQALAVFSWFVSSCYWLMKYKSEETGGQSRNSDSNCGLAEGKQEMLCGIN
jgi:glucans biosynthesis protein C